jgi:hypothetical protein
MKDATFGDTKHSELNFASPESLELMCLSILHFLIHIFIFVRNLGYRWTVKAWMKRGMDWVEIGRRTEEVNNALIANGLTMGYLKGGKIEGG